MSDLRIVRYHLVHTGPHAETLNHRPIYLALHGRTGDIVVHDVTYLKGYSADPSYYTDVLVAGRIKAIWNSAVGDTVPWGDDNYALITEVIGSDA
jgi:hypothetical protein